MSNLASAPFFDGMRFYYPPGQAADYFADGPSVTGFEPEVTRYLQSVFQKGMTFLDVGAHWGYYTLLASTRVRRVIAFEPKSFNRAVLLENARRNGLNNVSVVETPLFSEVVRGAIRKSRLRIKDDGMLETATLDSLNLFPGGVKVDVEGAELDVLKGAVKTLRRCKPFLVVEIHEHKIETFHHYWTEVYDFLADLGYTVTSIGRRRNAQFIKAEFGT